MTEQAQAEMSIWEHLRELRRCLIISLSGIMVMSIISFAWAGSIFEFLTSPLSSLGSAAMLIGTGPAEAFVVKLKLALASGFIISSPLTFYELWRFIAPGLHQHEKRYAVVFSLGSSLLFISGVAFCFFAVFPFVFRFFIAEYSSIGVAPNIRMNEYLSFSLQMLFVFGIIFELPLLSYVLASRRLITSQWLIKQARLAIVGIFVIAAILTPPDVITQILLAIPLLVLYALCIAITRQVEKRQ